MTEREQFDGTECEECIEREATEFFEDGSQLCGPCTIKFAHDRLSPEGRAALRAPASEGEAVAFTERGEPYPTDVAALTGIEWDAKELRKVGGMRHDVARLFAHYTVNESSEPVSAELLNLARAYLCLLATHPAPATVTEDISKHPTVERLTRERDQSHEVVELFVKRMGVTHSSGAGLVEAAFAKLDRMLAALGGAR